MKRTALLQLTAAIISLALLSCGSAKKITRGNFPSDTTGLAKTDTTAAGLAADRELAAGIAEKMRANHMDFKTFEGRLRVDYASDNGKSVNNMKVIIRMVKDSAIWISGSMPVVNEVVRAVITKDSLQVINKFQNTVILRDMKSARETMNIPFDFATLQGMLLGNPVYFNDSLTNIIKTPSVVSFSCQYPDVISLFNVFADDYTLQQSKVTDKDSTGANSRTCELTYGEYKTIQGRKFPLTRRVYVEEKSVVKVAMDFKDKVEFDIPVAMPFRIPANYKRE